MGFCLKTAVSVLALLAMLAGFAPAAEEEKRDPELVNQLFTELKMSELMTAYIDQALEEQITANPFLEDYRDVMRAFLQKYLSWDGIKTEVGGVYREAFTDQELKDLIAFYRTPTGKKALEKLPALHAKGAEIGMRRVMEHQDELREALDKRSRELDEAREKQEGQQEEPEEMDAPAKDRPAGGPASI